MADNLNFSVKLTAAVDDFNKGLQQAQNTFSTTVSSIDRQLDLLTSNSKTAETELQKIFKANDKDLTAAINTAAKAINGLSAGAKISDDSISKALEHTTYNTQQLAKQLDVAKSRVVALAADGAAPKSIVQAQKEVDSLTKKLSQSEQASATLSKAMTGAMARSAKATKEAEQQIDKLFGVRTDSQIQREIDDITTALKRMGERSDITKAELVRMTQAGEAKLSELRAELNNTTQATQKQGAAMDKAQGSGKRLMGTFGSLQGVLATLGVSIGASEILKLADRFKTLEATIRLATGGGASFVTAMNGVEQIASDTRVSLESTGELFAKITRATGEMDVNQAQVLSVTKTINQALVVSGATSEQASASIMQMGQALQGGVIRAEEYNSVMENTPRVMQAVADGMNMSMGELRAYMLEGKLSSEQFFSALQSQSDVLQAEFEQMPQTVGQSLQVLKDRFLMVIGEIDGKLQSSTGVSNFVQTISDSLDDIDPTALQAIEQVFGKLFDVAKQFAEQIVQTYNNFNDLLNAFSGADQAAQKVGFITRSLQGVSIILGVINDGITGIRIMSDLVLGVSAKWVGVLAEGLSRLSFGELSKSLGEFASRMSDVGSEAFERADQAAQAFKSSAVAALDDAAKTSSQRLFELATDSQQAYEQMKNDATASLEKQQEAFLQMANDRIAANDNVVSTALANDLKTEGSLLGLQVTFDKTGQIMTEAMAKPLEPAEQLKKSQEDIATANKEFGIGVSKSFAELTSKIAQTANRYQEFADAGANVGEMLAGGLQKAVNEAKNTAEIESLIAIWSELGEQGTITGEELALGLQLAQGKLDEMVNGVNSVTEAYKLMGLQTKKELAENAEAFQTSYDLIVKDGQASASQLQTAFEKQAKAVIAANNDTIPSWLKVQAAANGYALEVSENGRVSVKTAEQVKQANASTVSSFNSVTHSIHTTAQAAPSIGDGIEASANRGERALDSLNKKLSETQARTQRLDKIKAGYAKANANNRNLSSESDIVAFLKSAGVNDDLAQKQAKQLINSHNDGNGRVNWGRANGLSTVSTPDQVMQAKSASVILYELSQKLVKQQERQARRDEIAERNRERQAAIVAAQRRVVATGVEIQAEKRRFSVLDRQDATKPFATPTASEVAGSLETRIQQSVEQAKQEARAELLRDMQDEFKRMAR